MISRIIVFLVVSLLASSCRTKTSENVTAHRLDSVNHIAETTSLVEPKGDDVEDPCQTCDNDEPKEEKYPSRQEEAYYENKRSKKFQPEDIKVINNLTYNHIKVTEVNTNNKFKDLWDKTPIRKYYDSLRRICINNGMTEECMDPIRIMEERKIGDVYNGSIIRYDSLDDLMVMLYGSTEMQVQSLEYWVAISTDCGISWKKYYTGLNENYFYHIKPRQKIRLLKNKFTIQVEAALIRYTREAPYIFSDDFELLNDNIVLELNLNKLTADTDRDGLTDVLEIKFFTNPLKADTDNDGVDDLNDSNPRYKSSRNKYSVLYRYFLEDSFDSAFVSAGYKFRDIQFEDAGQIRSIMIVTDDLNLLHVGKTSTRFIIMTNREFVEYRKRNGASLEELSISPAFDVDNRTGWTKINVFGSFWSKTFLLIEKSNGWIVQVIDQQIS